MNNLKTLRVAANLSQSELAKELGISRTAVSKWEHGVRFPSTEKLMKLAKIFGCTIEELLQCKNKKIIK